MHLSAEKEGLTGRKGGGEEVRGTTAILAPGCPRAAASQHLIPPPASQPEFHALSRLLLCKGARKPSPRQLQFKTRAATPLPSAASCRKGGTGQEQHPGKVSHPVKVFSFASVAPRLWRHAWRQHEEQCIAKLVIPH